MVKCAVTTADGQQRDVVLVDTPGFDHTVRSNSSVVAQLAEWMTELYVFQTLLTRSSHDQLI